jgi:glycosyltransferase involved in cell wall biosynthesis
MKLMHYMKKENSGLARTTLELVKYEQKQGHEVCVKEPGDGAVIYGRVDHPDIELVHSQLPIKSYFNGAPKGMFCHGEPISSVANGISMKAIVDLAPKLDFQICMRRDEWSIWNSIRTTYLVRKGIDLEVYKPLDGITERLSGSPCVLYYENWRGNRNPLYLVVAMEQVWKKYPDARLHLYNCSDKRMLDTFRALIANNKYWPFVRSLQGQVNDVNLLLNRVDIVVSCLYPLYARSIEAFGAGKCFISPGYREHDYPFQCELDPTSIANAIIKAWENYDLIKFRSYAEQHHDVNDTVKECIEIYKRYID